MSLLPTSTLAASSTTTQIPFFIPVDLGTGEQTILSSTVNAVESFQTLPTGYSLINLAFPTILGNECSNIGVFCMLAAKSAQQVDLSQGSAPVTITVQLTAKADDLPAKNFVGPATITINSDGTISDVVFGTFSPSS